MSWIKDTVIVLAIAGVLFFSIDFFGERYLLNLLTLNQDELPLNPDEFEKLYRIPQNVYHHTLAPNFKGNSIWFREPSYDICTNSLGFKSSCDLEEHEVERYDIVVIGDSFVESIGMSYEDSFVGRVAKKITL